jgi:hypothetical protein
MTKECKIKRIWLEYMVKNTIAKSARVYLSVPVVDPVYNICWRSVRLIFYS